MSEPQTELSHAERARTLLAQEVAGALATLATAPPGVPYGSLVLYAAQEGDPIFLLSGLAEHTQNLRADPRASLLVAESFRSDALLGARVTLLGAIEAAEPALRPLFLERHPSAARYADFADFALYRLRVSEIRYVGGFGRMSWIEAGAYRTAEPDPIAPHAAGIIAHMNDDHGAALLAYARAYTDLPPEGALRLAVVDRYGFELELPGAGRRRLFFPQALRTPDEARKAFVALVREARALLGESAP